MTRPKPPGGEVFPYGTFAGDGHEDLVADPPPETLEGYWDTARGEDTDRVLHRMSKERLAQFVRNYCDGAIFTSADVKRQEDVGMVFLPAILGAFAGWEEERLKQVGLLYEYYSKAGPRSINGMPVFTSMHVMHADDWKKASRAIERELGRRKIAETSIEDDLEDD